MLLVLIIILSLTTGWLFYRHHHLWGIVAAIGLILSQGLLVLDSQSHYNTQVANASQISQIAPIASTKGNHIMVIEKVKQGKTVYTAYATKKPANQKVAIILNKQKQVKIKRDADGQPRVQTQNNQYHYQNALSKWLYFGVTNQGQLKKQIVTYHISNDWVLLTKKQLKKVGKKLESHAYQTKLTTTVKAATTAQVKKHPQLLKHPQQLKQFQNQQAKAFIHHTLRQAASA